MLVFRSAITPFTTSAGPLRLRSSALHSTFKQAYMPNKSLEDPEGLPLDSLGPWIGIKDQLADLSRPICPCSLLKKCWNQIGQCQKDTVFLGKSSPWRCTSFLQNCFSLATKMCWPYWTHTCCSREYHHMSYHSSFVQGGFFNWSALKMTKCQITCKFLQKSSKCQNFLRVWHLVIFKADQ